jgi:hypothetical protein
MIAPTTIFFCGKNSMIKFLSLGRWGFCSQQLPTTPNYPAILRGSNFPRGKNFMIKFLPRGRLNVPNL